MIVTLQPWEYIHAHDVGIKRAVANWSVKDKQSYTQGLNQPELIASPRAAIAELAVAKALNQYWGGHVWDNRDHKIYNGTIADVGYNIEVRCLRDRDNQGSVWEKDADKGLIIVVTYPIPPEYRQVEILGWLPADVAWDRGTEMNGRKVFDTDKLRAIQDLIK